MALWLILAVGLVIGLAMAWVGVRLLQPEWQLQDTRTQTGIALVTAAVISVVIFVLQILGEDRLRRDDAKREDQVANQALRLQLALSTGPLMFMDLTGEDLRKVNLVQKNLTQAIFDGADLREANLRGARLVRARFSNAKLGRANLYRAKLQRATLDGATLDEAIMSEANLSRAILRDAHLVGTFLDSADLRCADAQGADFTDAVVGGWKIAGLQYDGETIFPNGKKLVCADPPCPLKQCELD